MNNFLSNLPLRILSQYCKEDKCFYAWKFDGINRVGEKIKGSTRKEAIENLSKSN